jgi:hypothetical protein
VLFQVLPVSGYGQQEIIGRDKKRRSAFLSRRDTQQESDEFLLALRGMRTDHGVDVFGVKTDFFHRIEANHSDPGSPKTPADSQPGLKHSQDNGRVGSIIGIHLIGYWTFPPTVETFYFGSQPFFGPILPPAPPERM